MSSSGTLGETAGTRTSDFELVAGVRAGDDAAFEELYRRYHRRIRTFVLRRLHDSGRAEDVTQEAFLSALRRMRATDSEIVFKPWLFEIARNAAIDVHRRNSRAEEVPVDDDNALRASDKRRLIGAPAPDAEVFTRERLEHLSGAFDELPEVHHRALVMREFEGRSYREIGERLQLSRSAVESILFRARRRLEHEYGELEAGRHCDSSRATMALMAEGVDPGARRGRRFSRHVRRCAVCRRRAVELGVPLPAKPTMRDRAAALLPLPLFLRRRAVEASADGGASSGLLSGTGVQLGSGLAERAASLLAAAALAGAGGAALNGAGGLESPSEPVNRQVAPAQRLQPPSVPHGAKAPTKGTVTGDKAKRSRARKGERRGERWSPDRQGGRGQSAAGRGVAPPAGAPSLDGGAAQQGSAGAGLRAIVPEQPRSGALPDAPAAARSVLGVAQQRAAGLGTAQKQTETFVDTVGRKVTGFAGASSIKPSQ